MKSIAVASLLLVGCMYTDRPSNYYQLYIDPAFGTDMPAIEHAAAVWMREVNKYSASNDLRLVIHEENYTCSTWDSRCVGVITVHPASLANVASMCSGQVGDVHGCTYRQQQHEDLTVPSNDWANCYIAAGINDLPHVATHELGHGMGLQHTYNREDVMDPYTGAAVPDTVDVMQWEWNSGL